VATNVTVSLGTLIDETLSRLYRHSERPLQVTMSGAPSDAADTTLTLTTGDASKISITDVIEINQEAMLVTAVNTTTDVLTVARGYAGTTAVGTHAGTDPVLVQPGHLRADLSRFVQRCVSGPMNIYLPYITSATMYRTSGKQYIEMHADTQRVLSVRHMIGSTGRIIDVGGWQFEEDLPTGLVTSGKAVRVPSTVENDDALIVVSVQPYAWTAVPPAESSTLSVPLATEDLPSLWAAAYAITGHEITRLDLDQIEEWNQDAAVRQGFNVRLMRELWGEFYRRIDEARRVQNVPRNRTFRKMAKVII
jgi:hypothetical protein